MGNLTDTLDENKNWIKSITSHFSYTLSVIKHYVPEKYNILNPFLPNLNPVLLTIFFIFSGQQQNLHFGLVNMHAHFAVLRHNIVKY